MLNFRKYVAEVFEIPTGAYPVASYQIRTILKTVPKRSIVEFALHVAEDSFKFNDEQTISSSKRCIDAIKTWLAKPSVINARAAAAASSGSGHYYAAGTSAATFAAAAAAHAASTVSAKAGVNSADMAAHSSAAAWAYVNKDNWELRSETSHKKTEEYIAWAKSYHASTTNQNYINKQEIKGIIMAGAEYLPILIDYLMDRGLMPNSMTLKQFGVNNPNGDIAKQISDAQTTGGFYRSINKALGLDDLSKTSIPIKQTQPKPNPLPTTQPKYSQEFEPDKPVSDFGYGTGGGKKIVKSTKGLGG